MSNPFPPYTPQWLAYEAVVSSRGRRGRRPVQDETPRPPRLSRPRTPPPRSLVEARKQAAFDRALAERSLRERLARPLPLLASQDDMARAQQRLAYSPRGAGEWNAFRSDPYGAAVAAMAATEARLRHKGQNDPGDRDRHARWTASMAQTLGYERARAFSEAHERSVPTAPRRQVMDLINNQNGAALGAALPRMAPDEIVRRAAAAGLLQSYSPKFVDEARPLSGAEPPIQRRQVRRY